MALIRVLLLTLLIAHLCFCWSTYVPSIPNGALCERNGVAWAAVGHDGVAGGAVNAFGAAFAAAGHTWTKALCEADTDGDGQTNGYELGDEDCTWTPGSTPKRTTDISHPNFADSRVGYVATTEPPKEYPNATVFHCFDPLCQKCYKKSVMVLDRCTSGTEFDTCTMMDGAIVTAKHQNADCSGNIVKKDTYPLYKCVPYGDSADHWVYRRCGWFDFKPTSPPEEAYRFGLGASSPMPMTAKVIFTSALVWLFLVL